MSMKEKKEVIKHSAAIQIQNNITLLQRRSWNVLLANAYDELPTTEEHRISVQDLTQTLEFYSKNDDYLKEALRALVTCSVEWNILNKDGKTQWGVSALLASAVIESGLCTYAYSPELRRRLHNPAMYARLCLSIQNKFKSKHAQALWELCADYLGAERDYGETPFIPIADYRRMMGIAKDEYPHFFELNRRVIKEPVAEINRVSDFHVAVEYQRQRRKVTALKFKIRRVARLPEADIMQTNLFPALEEMPVVVKELQEAGMSSQDAWDIWQQGFRFVNEATRPANPRENADTAFVQYVREKIHLLNRRQASGRVDNSMGFLHEAIRRNYANPEFAQEQKRQAVVDAQQASKTREKQVKRLEEQHAEIAQSRDRALQELCGQIAVESPEILETLLPTIRAENYVFRQFYQPDQSALANYQVSPMLQIGFTPYLERHAPERFEAVKQHYAAQLAAVEAQLAALA